MSLNQKIRQFRISNCGSDTMQTFWSSLPLNVATSFWTFVTELRFAFQWRFQSLGYLPSTILTQMLVWRLTNGTRSFGSKGTIQLFCFKMGFYFILVNSFNCFPLKTELLTFLKFIGLYVHEKDLLADSHLTVLLSVFTSFEVGTYGAMVCYARV